MFEEGGPFPRPFIGNFGLRAEFGINKPSFYGFALLHKLGDRRLANSAEDVLVTKSSDGSLSVAAWNIVDPAEHGQPDSTLHARSKTVTLQFKGVPSGAGVSIERVDNEHGNVLPLYRAMGSPDYPTPAQVDELNRKTALPAAEQITLHDGRLELTLDPNALVLVKVSGR